MADVLQDEINRVNSLKDKAAFKIASEAVDEIERVFNTIPGQLTELRAGGYVYKNYFENNLKTLADQWQRQRLLLVDEIGKYQRTLTGEVSDIQNMHVRHVPAESKLTSLENKIAAAERSLESMYKGMQDAAKNFEEKVKDALWTVNQIKGASFSLQAGEAAFEAVPANWKMPGDKDGVEGVLFLTDRRLIFEQREEIATKKVLFITTAKQKLQSVQWELPVSAITGAVASKRGFMNKDDFLTLTASSGSFQTTDLHLRGESGDAWQKMIEQVRSGTVMQERFGQRGNVHNWGVVPGAIVGAAEGPIRIRAAGKVRYTGDMDTGWLNSIISQRFTDLVGGTFSDRSRSEVPVLQSELPAPLKSALLEDFQSHGCMLMDLQIDLIEAMDI